MPQASSVKIIVPVKVIINLSFPAIFFPINIIRKSLCLFFYVLTPFLYVKNAAQFIF